MRSGLLEARTSIPASPAGLVARRSLYAALDRASQGRLTVVSAGPGWGKTSTVSGWAAQHSRHVAVAWLSVEPDDDGLAAFWAAVLQALRSTGRIPADHSLAMLRPAQTMSAEMLQATYQGLLALSASVVLVLDDFHVIEDPAVLDSVARLLGHNFPVHLMLLTRSDPVLPLHRLRLAGELSEIVADDLAFNRAELAALAAAAGLNLHKSDLDRIRDRTDGWPAGVRLAILHLTRPGVAGDLSDFGGSDRSVAEYFVAEVLERQSPATREFLLHTSVESRICADLANAIVPGSWGQQRLETLEHSNQFVTALGPDRRWYQYHPLLREMLEHLLARDEPDEFRAAHVRAARWLAGHGEPVAALRHAARAEDWTLFSTIFVESGWPAVLGPDRDVVAGLLTAVPYDNVMRTAPLAVCAGTVTFLQGRLVAVQAHVEIARQLLPSTPEEVRPATAATVELLACISARGRSDFSAMQRTAGAVLGLLDRADRSFPAFPSLRAVATNNLAVGLLWSGRTDSAGATFPAAADAATQMGLDLAAMNAWAHLALCHLVEGNLDEAERVAARALELAEPRGLTTFAQLRNAHLTRAIVSLLHGDTDEADHSIVSGLAATEGGVEPATTTALCVCQALVAVSRRRARAADQALDEAMIAAASWTPPAFLIDWHTRATTEALLLSPAPSNLAEGILRLRKAPASSATAQVCLARLLLASGDFRGSKRVALAGCELVDGRTEVDLFTQVEASLTLALVADHLRRDHESLEHLGRALDMARGQRLWRPFLVTDSDRLPMLVRRRLEMAPHSMTAVEELLAKLGDVAPSSPEPEPLAKPLTDRELTVLWALPSMQTNLEIANELFVSVNTVKAHLSGLYRKLGVSNRRDAIRRSRALGLLS